jgi:hypothetical protein
MVQRNVEYWFEFDHALISYTFQTEEDEEGIKNEVYRRIFNYLLDAVGYGEVQNTFVNIHLNDLYGYTIQ